MPMSKTVRQTIIELLRQQALTAWDLAEILGIKEREVAEHLEHVARSVSCTGKIRVEPARCKQCGFVFTKRKQFKSPSRCPQCRSQQVERPRFSIS